MASRPRVWESLADSTKRRYLSKGRTQGLTEAQVKAHYTSGGPLGDFRGHRPRPGASERQWARLVRLAKAAWLNEDVDGDMNIVLESLLAKGYKPAWIEARLIEKRESRATYRSPPARKLRQRGNPKGWDPGRPRYYRRDLVADIEVYYYH